MCQDTRSGGLNDLLASAEIGHDALVDLSRKEAFEAPDDLAFGSAIGGASGDVVAGGLVESHADDDGAIEGSVGVAVAASIEAVPAGGHPGRGRDRARAAELRERGFRTNPVGVIAEDDQQLGRGVGAHTEALAEGRCCLGREAREVLVVYRNFLCSPVITGPKKAGRSRLPKTSRFEAAVPVPMSTRPERVPSR